MENALCHHGIKGQKWGVRRYQNPDGTWTDAGKRRYGDSDGPEENSDGKKSSSTKKKVAIGVATGTAIVAGTVLTAYLVRKYGAKNISNIADTASVGKEAFQDLLKSTPIASTPVKQIPTPKVEPKQVIEKAIQNTSTSASQIQTSKANPKSVLDSAVKSVSTTAASISRNQIPSGSVSKPSYEIPPAHTYESLMKQNNELLKKMLAELA